MCRRHVSSFLCPVAASQQPNNKELYVLPVSDAQVFHELSSVTSAQFEFTSYCHHPVSLKRRHTDRCQYFMMLL